MKKVYLLCYFCLFSIATSYAQAGDCVDAVVICDDGGVSANSPNSGAVNDFASGNNGCLATGETQSNWYYFEMNGSTPPSSLLGFSISSSSGSTDFDFAVYGPDVECGSLGFPIRCSFDAPGPYTTGLVAGDGDFSEGAFGGNGFLEALTVNAGEGFYLIVNNYSNDGTGFNMTWSEAGAPFLNCDANPTCDLLALPPPPVDVCEDAAPFFLSGGSSGGFGGATYLWTASGLGISYLDDPTSATPLVTLPPGFNGSITYTLNVLEDACTDMADVLVTVNPLPIVTIPPAGPFCADADPQFLVADPSGGTWGGVADGAGQIDPALLGPGVHTVTYNYGDAFGCMNDATLEITIQESPMVMVLGDLEFCISEGFTVLDAIGSLGDGNYSFIWDTPAGPTTGPSIIASMPGMYSVTVQDGNICEGTEMVQVQILPNPDVLIFPPAPICESGDIVVLSGVPFGGVWDVSTGIIDANGAVDPAIIGAGTFHVSYTFTDVNGCDATADLNFDINAAPTAMASTGGPYCDGALAELFGSTSAPGVVTYSWTGPGGFTSTDQNPANVAVAGTYTLIASVDNCPADPVTVDITFAQAPDAAALNNGPYCRDEIIELLGSTTAAGAVTYSWTGPSGYTSNLQNPTNATASGTYTLVVSADGCPSFPVTTDVTVMEVPDAMASNAGPYCAGENILLFGSTTSPGLSINYSWIGPNGYISSEQNPSDATEPGIYTLVIDVDGCSSDNITTTVSVTATPIAQANNNGPFCYTSPIELTGATSVMGINITYTWTGPNGYNSFIQNPTDATESGIYTLTVNVDGCLSDPVTTEVVITAAPDAFAANDGPYCPEDPLINLTGDTPAFGAVINYSWTGPNGYVSSEQNPSDATLEGIYTLNIMVDGCPSFPVNTEVNFHEAPTPQILGGESFCDGDMGQLDGGDGYTNYEWSGGLSGQLINISTSGTYELTVTDVNGCTGETSIDVSTFELPTTTIDGNDVFCEGLSTLLDAGFGFVTYEWSDGQFGQVVEVNFTDTYVVTITDNNGCTNTALIDITVNENPDPTIAGALTFCTGTSTTLDAGAGFTNYEWSDGSDDQELNVTTAGTYTVTVTNDGGCTGTEEVMVEISDELDPIIVGETTFCDGTETTLDVGTSFTNYEWSNGMDDPSITVDATGTYSVTVTDAAGCTGTAEVDVSQNNLPVVTINGNNPICNGEMISLDAGAGFTNYNWGDGSGDQMIDVSAGGTYFVTVTDGNGCTGTAEVTVVENLNPTPTINGPADFCEGTMAMLDAGSGYTDYEWSTGDNDQTLDVGASGTYFVTVTDGNGCTGITDYTINQNTNPSVTINGNTPICEGAMTTLDAGAGYTNYEWSDGTDGQTLDVNAEGTFSVTITDANGCVGTAEVSVLQNTNPLPTITGPADFCAGTMATLDAGNGYTNYEWSSGGGDQNLDVSSAGIYFVTVTDGNGCTGISDFTIAESPELQPTINGPVDFCEGTMAMLDAGSGYTNYEWSVGGNGQTLEVNGTGIYIVTVSDASGCTGTADFTITQNTNPLVTINGNNPICEDGMVTLDAGAGYTNYQWSNNSLNQTLIATAGGTYEVTVTDANGCTGIGLVEVVENQNPTPQIIGPDNFCASTMATLDAGAGYTNYEWSDGSSNQTLEVTTTGTYAVTITDQNGCIGMAEFSTQENPLPNPMIAGSTTFCPGTSTTLDAGTGYTNYQWSDGSGQQSLEVSTTGTYEVTVTDANGCTGTNTLSVSESQSLNPIISGDLNYCFGEVTMLDAGTGFTQYEWSDGSGSQALEVTMPGTYSVTVSDASGCSGTNEVVVVENALPVVDILGNAPICAGETVTLNAGSGYTNYMWSNNSLNQELEVGAGGVYIVTVTNTNGCTNIGQVTVVENANPNPNINGPTDFCIGTMASLDAGSGYINYEWSNGTANQNLDVTDGGTYSVTVTDANGCQGIDEFNIIQNTAATPNIDGVLTFCEGENTLLEASDGYINYEWSDGTNNQSLQVTLTGTYSVTVTDQNSCTSTTSVSVMQNENPTPVIAGSSTFCLGSTTTLDAGLGYASYQWSDGSGGQTLEISEPGTYSITVTNQNGCEGTGGFMVTQSAELTPIISGDLDFCLGDNTVLDAGSGFTNYEWSNGTNGQSIMVETPGSYMVTVSDASGCSGTAEVVVDELNLPTTNIMGNMPICTGSSLALDAGDGFSNYEWSNGSLNQTLEVTEAGWYTVTITDANGCANVSQTEVIVYPDPTPVIDGATSFCTGNTSTINGGNFTSYQWSNNAATAEIIISEGGTYGLTVTDNNGCTGTASITVSENESLSPVITGDMNICAGGMSELDAGTGFATYTWSDGSDGQTLNVNSTGTYQVTVTDSNGCSGETEASLIVNNNPEPMIAGSSTFCIGTSTILDGGSGYSSYEWSNGTLTANNEVAVAGTYDLTVTDANGCVGMTSFTVTESSSLQPVISGDLNYCNGGNTLLDAGSGFTNYQWSNGDVTSTIMVDVPGTYSVTVSDASGCSGTVDVDVVEDNLPVVAILGNQPACDGGVVSLDAGAGFSYVWSNGSLNQTLDVATSGTYSVTVVDGNGCENADQVDVVVHPNPLPVIDGIASFCTGTSTNLDAGAGFLTYNWSDGQMTQNITVAVPGLMGVTVTDANGCTGEASMMIEESANLNPSISGDPIICENGNTTLDAGTGFTTYLWSTGDQVQNIQVDEPGDYSVTVTDASGCSGETILTVMENTLPFAEVLPDANTCNTTSGGSEVNLTSLIVNGETTGTWTDVDGSGASANLPMLDFDGVAPGMYTFSYSTNSAIAPCTEQTYFTTILVEDCACPSVNFNTPDPLCNVDGILDLTSQIQSGGSGVWTLLSAPAGSNPAALSGNILDATNADVGQYVLEYTLDETPPPGCDDAFLLEVLIDNALTAGVANPPLGFCESGNMIVNLSTEIIGADAGGSWTETSAVASIGGAFDPTTATFTTTNQVPGTYTFQYELLANGACPGDTETVSITINELPVAEAGTGTELTCDANEFVLTGSGSTGNEFAISWSGPGLILNDNTLTPTINAPGMFTLTILNQTTGCETTDVVEITQDANVPIALAQANGINCDSTSVVLFGGSNIGGSNITWQWSGPGINNTNMALQYPTVTEPGDYTLIITNESNNCASSPVLINVADDTNPPNLIVDLPLSTLDCNTSVVTLDATSSSGGGILTYQWLDANGNVVGDNAVLTVDNAGNYTLVITDVQSGCSASNQIEVEEDMEQPIANAGNPQMLNCGTTQVQLNGSASSSGSDMVYTWSNAAGVIVQGASNNPIANVNESGNYTLLIENESNGCTASATVEVNQDIQSPLAQIQTPDQLDCTISEIVLNASNSSTGPQYTYQWLDASSNNLSSETLLTVANAGTYQFVVTNTENECSSTESVEVNENTNVPSAAILDINQPSCFGENDGTIGIAQVLGGTAPYVYCIDGSPYGTLDQFNNLTEGEYGICLQDAAGCTWDTIVTVNQPSQVTLDIELALDVIQLGEQNQLTADFNIPQSRVDTLIWTPADLLTCDNEFCNEPTTNITSTTAFEATVIDVDGCLAKAAVQVVVDKERLVYIPSAFSPNDDQNNDVFMIHAGIGVRKVNIFRVYNRWGEQVFSAALHTDGFQPNDPAFGWDGTFKNEPMNPAVFVYYAEVEFEDGETKLYKGDVTLAK